MDKPKTLQDAIQYFSDEQTCIDTVAAMRWPNGKPVCPACAFQGHYYLASQKRWKCKDCGKQFSVKLGTIFEDSAIPLNKWLVAVWLIANCKNGISSYEIGRSIGVTQKSAWFMLHRIRLAMADSSFTKIGGEGSTVEIDETYVGGKLSNISASRRRKRGIWGSGRGLSAGKAVVMGILDRETRQVRAIPIPSAKRKILEPEVRKHVAVGTQLMTDDWPAYFYLSDTYVHNIIKHSVEYVNGHVHTNGIENFWSLLKRGLTGTYISVEPFHLQAYVEEQVFRYNNRGNKDKKITDAERKS